MKIIFTTILVFGYLGHSALFFIDGKPEMASAMVFFAMAMWLLF